jgi:sulfoquinovosidase
MSSFLRFPACSPLFPNDPALVLLPSESIGYTCVVMRIALRIVPLAVLLSCQALSACFCGQQQLVRLEAGGTEVKIDGDAERITVTRGGRTLLDIPAHRIGIKDGDAFYDMEFGMFDIQEDFTPYRFASDLVVVGPGDFRTAGFQLLDANGGLVANGSVLSTADVVLLSLSTEVGSDRIFAASTCTLDHAIGFGAQTHDVDHKGQIIPSWVSEQGVGKVDTDELPTVWQVVGRRHTSHAPLPTFVTDRGVAINVSTNAFARTSVCADGAAYHGALANPARGAPTTEELAFEVFDRFFELRIYAADSPREALAKLSDDRLRPPLLPPWALAPWNDAIFGTDSVRAFAERIRAEDIPSSAIWSEDWRGGEDVGGGLYRLDEDWRVDAELYPNFDELVDDVRALGFQQLVYFNTFVTQGGDVFNEITEGGLSIKGPDGLPLLFTGVDADFSPTTLLDLSSDAGKAYVSEHLNDALDLGVRGWMADFAEWLPVEDTVLASGEDPALAHNKYPLEWQRVNRDAIASAGLLEGDDAAIAFVRSGWNGSQALAQVFWAGDQRTSFDADDGLPTVLPIGIGLASVGFPFITHDVAGYQSSTNDPVDLELFQRWSALGAFTPVMRTHHGTHAFANVQVFTDETTTSHWKRYAEIHIRLYPYLRRAVLDAVAPGGAPVWTPMPLAFPADDAMWSLKDQIMLGPSLLVAPVVTQGATSRDVVFPSARFVRFDVVDVDVDVAQGPTTINVGADVGEIPVFIVAGGIVPMTSEAADTLMRDPDGDGPITGLESTEGDRVVYVALGAPGSFVEESGASYVLEGDGVEARDDAVTGNDVIQGAGFTFTLTEHPDARTTRVIFR